MHHYDCPCATCRGLEGDTLHQRVLDVIERLEQELAFPRVEEHDRALRWLEAVCGGPAAVRALDAVPLSGPVPLPDDARAHEVAGLVRSVAREMFDVESAVAFDRALGHTWAADPGLVTAPVSPAYVAAGLVWAVGEANGVVGTGRPMTSARLKKALAVPGTPATYARPISRALRGLWTWHSDAGRPEGSVPALTPLGHPDLLTSRTRAQLVRVRDHALAARTAHRGCAT